MLLKHSIANVKINCDLVMTKRAAYKNNSSSNNTTKLSKIDVWWREKQFMTRGQFVSEKSKRAVEPSIKIDIHNITTMLHSRAHMFICYADLLEQFLFCVICTEMVFVWDAIRTPFWSMRKKKISFIRKWRNYIKNNSNGKKQHVHFRWVYTRDDWPFNFLCF